MNIRVIKYLSPLLLTLLAIGCDKLPVIYEILNNKSPEQGYIYMGDPYILNYESMYYLYGTTSDDGFQVFESDDLINWSRAVGSKNGFALHEDDVWGDKWFWAPEVYFENDQFYMFFSVDEHIAVATANSPKGPFIQEEEKLLISNRNAIDPHVFIDDNGKKYLYYVVFNNGNEIWCTELNSDLLSIIPGTEQKCFSVSQSWERNSSPPVANINEGPFVIKRGINYYLTYSANHYASQDYGIGFAVSTSPTGPWTKYSGNPILQSPGDLKGTGHHSLFRDNNNELNIVFHSHNSRIFVNPRKVYISKITFEDSINVDFDVISLNKINFVALRH